MRVQRRLIFEFFDRYEAVTPVNIDIKIELRSRVRACWPQCVPFPRR